MLPSDMFKDQVKPNFTADAGAQPADAATGRARRSNEPLLLTIPDVMRLLQIGRNRAYEICNAADGPRVIRLGATIRVARTELERWILERTEVTR